MMNFGIGGIGMIFFWIILIALAIYAIRSLLGSSIKTEESKLSPIDILKQRYASGEISYEEFERMKKEMV